MVGTQTGRVEALIDRLALAPHPEGGYYREIFRSSDSVSRCTDQATRSSLTSIYYLLMNGQHSSWHRVAADEAWHWCEGAPMELLIAAPELEVVHSHLLGPLEFVESTKIGTEPTQIVPAGHWQAARSTGEYTLVSCDVGPGFDFADFELLRDLPDTKSKLTRHLSGWLELC